MIQVKSGSQTEPLFLDAWTAALQKDTYHTIHQIHQSQLLFNFMQQPATQMLTLVPV